MKKLRIHEIKKDQKKASFFRELSVIFRDLAIQDARLDQIFVTRVELSADNGFCSIYLSTINEDTEATVMAAIETLKLYKGSMRTALSKRIHGRYVPSLIFIYDKIQEKERRVHDLLNEIIYEEKP